MIVYVLKIENIYSIAKSLIYSETWIFNIFYVFVWFDNKGIQFVWSHMNTHIISLIYTVLVWVSIVFY